MSNDAEFDAAWAKKGYSYGRDELENVKLGWDMARQSVPDDWKLVPNIPTPEMIRAAQKDDVDDGNYFLLVALYQYMIAAAPLPPKENT
jgi:hypothetical protein